MSVNWLKIRSENAPAPTFTAVASVLVTLLITLVIHSLFRMFYFRLTYGEAPIALSDATALVWASSVLILFIAMAVAITIGAWRRQPFAFIAAAVGVVLVAWTVSLFLLDADLRPSFFRSPRGISTSTKVLFFVSFVATVLVAYDIARLKMLQQLVKRAKTLLRLRFTVKEIRNFGFWLAFLPVGTYTGAYLIPNMVLVVTGFGRYEVYEKATSVVVLLGAMFVIVFMVWILWRLLCRSGSTASLFALAMQCSFSLWGYLWLVEHGMSVIVAVGVVGSYVLLSLATYARLYKKPVSCYI